DPIMTGQLSREEIARGERDTNYRLRLSDPKVRVPESKRRTPRYTPISRRNERPAAIKWLLRNHPELKDAQIMRLVGTTKSTIDSVREGTHWNNANITAADPVTLGLASQIDLDLEVSRASKGAASEAPEMGTMLLTAEEALNRASAGGEPEAGEATERNEREEIDADSVFASLKSLKGNDRDDEE
ncbi:MAG: cell cycle transcriptional regulator TrcR, partial [Devosia sp.]